MPLIKSYPVICSHSAINLNVTASIINGHYSTTVGNLKRRWQGYVHGLCVSKTFDFNSHPVSLKLNDFLAFQLFLDDDVFKGCKERPQMVNVGECSVKLKPFGIFCSMKDLWNFFRLSNLEWLWNAQPIHSEKFEFGEWADK